MTKVMHNGQSGKGAPRGGVKVGISDRERGKNGADGSVDYKLGGVIGSCGGFVDYNEVIAAEEIYETGCGVHDEGGAADY